MERKISLMFTAIFAIIILFSLTAIAQEQETTGTAVATESEERAITYKSLQTQNEELQSLKKSITEANAQYTANCVNKTFSAGDAEEIKKCKEEYSQLVNDNTSYKEKVKRYNDDLAQYKEASAQKSSDTK